MARAWRIEYEGAYYHLLSRGNERRDIFPCDEDRSLFLDTIGECGERFEIDIFSYVLMSNHISGDAENSTTLCKTDLGFSDNHKSFCQSIRIIR